MKINIKDLKVNKLGQEYPEGYRVVYFYNNYYSIGEYCKTLEGFMIGFAENSPILKEDDIPKFISIDDLLDRYLNDVPNAESIGIYKTDGTLVARKDKIESFSK